MYKIIEKEEVAAGIRRFTLEAPKVARKCRAGQFVMILLDEKGERIPLAIAGYDREKGTVDIVVSEVGKTTCQLGEMEAGSCIRDVVGPLGKPVQIENFGTVAVIGGGVGAAQACLIAEALKEAGNNVIGIVGARNKDMVFGEDRMKAACGELYVATDDGSYGRKGMITDVLEEVIRARGKENISRIVAVGSLAMMMACSKMTEKYGISTTVCVRTLMLDGMGMCGRCRINVGSEMKFVCTDGPEFDGHKVDWSQLLKMETFFHEEEAMARKNCRTCGCGGDK